MIIRIYFIAGRIAQFYKIMNSSINHQSLFATPFPFLNCEPSPYLSPLFGSASNLQQSSHDELNDFHLQDDLAFEIEIPIGGDLEQNSLDASLTDILLNPEQPQPVPLPSAPSQMPLKTQIQTPYILPSPNKSKVYQIISFLSSNDHLVEAQLLAFGRTLYEGSEGGRLEFVFRALLGKFLKLRKTKEEMVKYCMRKAFKFIGDAKKQKNGKQKKQKSQRKASNEMLFSMPFRKNSSQKTMNSQYLKSVFSNPEFVGYYREFLNSIEQIIQEDNNSKVLYLADSIEKLLSTGNIGDVEKIKRLPWNRTILRKTSELAKTLIQFAGQGEGLGIGIGMGEQERDNLEGGGQQNIQQSN